MIVKTDRNGEKVAYKFGWPMTRIRCGCGAYLHENGEGEYICSWHCPESKTIPKKADREKAS